MIRAIDREVTGYDLVDTRRDAGIYLGRPKNPQRAKPKGHKQSARDAHPPLWELAPRPSAVKLKEQNDARQIRTRYPGRSYASIMRDSTATYNTCTARQKVSYYVPISSATTTDKG